MPIDTRLFPLVKTCICAAVLLGALCSTATAQSGDWEDDDNWEAGDKDSSKKSDKGKDTSKRASAKKENGKTPAHSKKEPLAKKKSAPDAKDGSASDDSAQIPVRLGASVGFYAESGAIRDDERREALRDNRDEEYDAGLDPSVMLQLWFPLSDIFQVSTGLRYGGVYQVSTGENDDDVFGFGHQLEAHVGMEAWIDAFAGLHVLVGLRGGFGAIFPTDELDTEIERVQGQGANAWSTPRLGLLFSPLAGARWQIGDLVAIRGDIAVSFGRYFLFNYSGTVAGVYYERSAVANFTRYEVSAGIEFALGTL